MYLTSTSDDINDFTALIPTQFLDGRSLNIQRTGQSDS